MSSQIITSTGYGSFLGGTDEILYVDSSGNLQGGGYFDGTNFKVPGYIEGQGYAGGYYGYPSITPYDFSHMSLALYDGQSNGFMGIYAQSPGNYWRFLQTDNDGNWVSSMTFGDPVDGTITCYSTVWDNSAFIIGGYGGGFGGSYMRLTNNSGQGAELGDALGGQFNINNGTVFVNQGYMGGVYNTNQIFAVYDNNGNPSFQVTRTDPNAYGDYVTSTYNILDYGNGQMAIGSAPTIYALTINDQNGTGWDIGNWNTGLWNISNGGLLTIQEVNFITTASAPTLNATPVFTHYYGGNTNALGAPTGWLQIQINGTSRAVPYY